MNKEEIKQHLENLISNGELENAVEVIEQYKKIFGYDDEMASMEAVIEILQNNLNNAKKTIYKALNIFGEKFDLLYNLAYVYSLEEKWEKANNYYLKALEKSNDSHIKEDIQRTINKFRQNYNIENSYNRRKVLIIAHIFPPIGGSGVQRTLKFIKYLRDYNWEPIIVTVGDTVFNYFKDNTLLEEIPEGIEVIRIDEKSNYNNREIQNMLDKYSHLINDKQIISDYNRAIVCYNENNDEENLQNLLMIPDMSSLWAMDVLEKIEELIDFNEIDTIYTTSGPYSDHIIGYFLKERYEKKWVADFRDEWTNNPYINFDKESIYYKIIKKMENEILKTADKIISVTPTSKENYINKLHVPESKISMITNGYDESDFKNINISKNKNTKFTIIHNGMFYMIRTPETFLNAIKNLIDTKQIDKEKLEIKFSYTENEENIKKYLKNNSLEGIVKFTQYMNHVESIEVAMNSDLLLLVVGPGEKNKDTYPGKVFEYLRMNKPILALSPKNSVVEKLLSETNSGNNYDFNDIIGIQNYIKDMYDNWKNNMENSDNIGIKKYERKCLTGQLADVLDELVFIEYEELNLRIKYSISNKIINLYQHNNNVEIINIIVNNYNNSDRYEEILNICIFYNEKINDSTGIIYFVMGYIYNQLQKFNKAISCHKKSLELDASLADMKYKEYTYNGKYDEGVSDCIGCGNNKYEIVNVLNQSLIETNLGIINPLRIWVRCKECGLIYCNPMPGEDSLNKYYELIWKERRKGGKYTDVESTTEFLISMSNRRLEKLENVYKKKGSLLDIGTGIGTFTGVAKERGWNAEGLEFNKYDCDYAEKKYGLKLLQENFYDFAEDRTYDVVTMFEVIEHLRSPLKDLKKINTLIKDDGMFVVATPIVDSLHVKKEGLKAANWYVATHLSYFSFDVLKAYLYCAGFEVKEINYSPEGFGRFEFYCAKIKNI